jgi:hypothetical protein
MTFEIATRLAFLGHFFKSMKLFGHKIARLLASWSGEAEGTNPRATSEVVIWNKQGHRPTLDTRTCWHCWVFCSDQNSNY